MGHEKSEKFIRFLEGYDCQRLQFIRVEVQLLEHSTLVRGQNVVSLLASDDLADRMGPDE